MKVKLTIAVMFLIFVIASSINGNTELIDELEQRPLQVFYIDVGQGDCALIKFNDEYMLIDSGEAVYADDVISFIKSKNITKLKYVVATHPHSDHIGGLSEILQNFEVESIIMPKVTTNTQIFEDLIKTIKEKEIEVIVAKVNDKYNLGDSEFVLLAPFDIESDNLNDYSVVIRLLYKNASFIFTADVESNVENQISSSFSNLKSTVLKVAHHGSTTSSSQAFIDAVKPSICVISVGENNSYNHPHKEVVDRLSKICDNIFRTDLNGTIAIYTDGNNLDVLTSK